MSKDQFELPALTARIVAAFVAKNPTPGAELPLLISTVHRSLHAASEGLLPPGAARPTPAQIRKSITPDALISFEDGRAYQVLRRHLRARGMTIDDYKAKWGLPQDYPIIAPAYSARRSQLAKALGLGHLRKKAAASSTGTTTSGKTSRAGVKPAPSGRPHGRGKPG